jgi:hypothetical protein
LLFHYNLFFTKSKLISKVHSPFICLYSSFFFSPYFC